MAMPAPASAPAPEIEPTSAPEVEETVQQEPQVEDSTNPFESMTDEEIVGDERIRRLIQSRSDRVASAQTEAVRAQDAQRGARTQQETQLSSALDQLRGMSPEQVHEHLVNEVEQQLTRSRVSGPMEVEAQKQASGQVLQALVNAVHGDLGDLSSTERERLDPNAHESLTSFIQAFSKVVSAREKASGSGKALESEKKVAKAEARQEAREKSPLQEVGQGQAGANVVDVSDLKGSGNVFEALRRGREARTS